MKYLIAILLFITLSGCSTIQKLTDYAAAANDEAVTTATFTICNAASVGSIKRQFNTTAKVKTWKELCNDKTDFEP